MGIYFKVRQWILAGGMISTGVLSAFAADYSAWTHNLNVCVNTSSTGAQITQTLTNFPVLVRLTSTTSGFTFSQAAANGNDIRFGKAATAATNVTPLSFQIERWDAANQQADIWVNMDVVYPNQASQGFVMYWGNSSAASASSGSATFDSTLGYRGIWHMADTLDATLHHNNFTKDATITAPACSTGMIGKSYYFSGTNAWVIPDAPSIDMGGNFSVSMWMKYEQANLGWLRLLDRTSTSWQLIFSADSASRLIVGTGVAGTGFNCDNLVDNWTNSVWRHLAITFSADTLRFYVDAVLKTKQAMVATAIIGRDTVCDSTYQDLGIITCEPTRYDTIVGGASLAPVDNDLPIIVGAESPTGPSNYIGKMDEIRLEKQIRSADWVTLSYNNQKADQNVVLFGGTLGVIQENPAFSTIKNNLLAGKTLAKIQLFDMRGRMVAAYTGSSSEYAVHPELLLKSTTKTAQSGMYLVRLVTTDKATLDRKMVLVP